MGCEDYVENYQDLGNAIVLQAVRDYKRALRLQRKYPNKLEPKDELERLDRFFHSYLFSIIVSMEPKEFIRLLRESF